MNNRHSAAIVFAVALLLAPVGLLGAADDARPSAPQVPLLEQAGEDLARGRLDAAAEAFARVSNDTSAPAFVRGLAMLGLAETALARRDIPAAIQTWRQLAADAAMPQLHRDIAASRITGQEQEAKGLAARDPAAHRAQLPVLPTAGVVYHVAPTAGPDGDGSAARPFAGLDRARDAIRGLRRSRGGSLPAGGVSVIVHGGQYAVKETFNLTAEDSGTDTAPVVYRAAPGQWPVFTGGIRIPAWRPVSNPDQAAKLDPAVRTRVLEADLKALGLTDLGDATTLRQQPELFCDGTPQTLARWPNEGFVKTGEILGTDRFKVWNSIEGCRDGRFQYVEDRPGRWTDEPDVRLYGYWFWDWFEEYQKVESIDAAAGAFTLARPWSNYGYRKNQRYHAVNVFRELDRPGEWYLDRRTGIVYWLPPDGVDASRAMTSLSVHSRPFVVLQDVRNVLLIGLTIQEGRGDGIHIRGGADCLVAGCTIRQLGGDAVVVSGGQRHGVFGCAMSVLGCGGVRMNGGDRKTLAAGNHLVENCTVADISRIKRTYTPAVHLDGCGNRIAHNRFERIPSSAMRIEGNDHLVEFNSVARVVEESDDQGGIDMWGNPLYRGVVIRWNRWSDIRGGTECGAAGIRLDDMISGVAIYGNLFERCGEKLFGGVQIHGGKENLVDANVFIDCHAGVSFSRWGQKRWLEAIAKFADQAVSPPYSTRYPDLARLKQDADVSYISRNLFVGCRSVFLRDGGIQRNALNAVLAGPLDIASLSDQATINARAELRRILFPAIPVDQIGPYDHPWRAPVR